MENFEFYLTKLETELTVNNYKLKHNISDEEFNARVKKQLQKIKAARITNILTKDINLG